MKKRMHVVTAMVQGQAVEVVPDPIHRYLATLSYTWVQLVPNVDLSLLLSQITEKIVSQVGAIMLVYEHCGLQTHLSLLFRRTMIRPILRKAITIWACEHRSHETGHLNRVISARIELSSQLTRSFLNSRRRGPLQGVVVMHRRRTSHGILGRW